MITQIIPKLDLSGVTGNEIMNLQFVDLGFPQSGKEGIRFYGLGYDFFGTEVCISPKLFSYKADENPKQIVSAYQAAIEAGINLAPRIILGTKDGFIRDFYDAMPYGEFMRDINRMDQPEAVDFINRLFLSKQLYYLKTLRNADISAASPVKIKLGSKLAKGIESAYQEAGMPIEKITEIKRECAIMDDSLETSVYFNKFDIAGHNLFVDAETFLQQARLCLPEYPIDTLNDAVVAIQSYVSHISRNFIDPIFAQRHLAAKLGSIADSLKVDDFDKVNTLYPEGDDEAQIIANLDGLGSSQMLIAALMSKETNDVTNILYYLRQREQGETGSRRVELGISVDDGDYAFNVAVMTRSIRQLNRLFRLDRSRDKHIDSIQAERAYDLLDLIRVTAGRSQFSEDSAVGNAIRGIVNKYERKIESSEKPGVEYIKGNILQYRGNAESSRQLGNIASAIQYTELSIMYSLHLAIHHPDEFSKSHLKLDDQLSYYKNLVSDRFISQASESIKSIFEMGLNSMKHTREDIRKYIQESYKQNLSIDYSRII
ncbi:MAG: hypothetical protein NDI94_01955 [Candidatus Woesearchaeota archaeon]|nr:hypothetical protein [Candidatus Woesearchaeota archaeon]